ncbi:MAG: cytochrome c oxidase assembly protein [Mariniblastus sp.]|nr:cytochrome c oxidase assembly protein [Mariniblastus sp.]
MILTPELWHWTSPIWWAVGLILVLYFLAFRRVEPARLVALLLALAFMTMAYVSPIGYLADGYVFSAHMIQHLLMLLVVPLCLLLSLPRNQPKGTSVSADKLPALKIIATIGWIGGVGAMWFWHVPSLCTLSTQTLALGIVRDASFLLAGLAFWWPIYGPLERTRLQPPVGILYLFSACLGCSLLGIYITFTSTTVCPIFANPTDSIGIMGQLYAAGMTPAVDQSIGGLLMWIPPCMLYTGAIISLLARWYTTVEHDHPPSTMAHST